MQDGTRSTTLVRPSQPVGRHRDVAGSLAVVGAYLMHGVEHILFGFDHLLFVLALILIVRSTRMLFLTMTAFTVAHSITLSLATLGVVHVPGPPVEACIALSILLLASEIVRLQAGGAQPHRPLALGGGFFVRPVARARFRERTVDIGLPQGDIPLALFAFNMGVEVGQLAFIAVVICTMLLAKQFRVPAWGRLG